MITAPRPAALQSFVILGVFLLLACAPIVGITRRDGDSTVSEEAPEPT